MSRTDAMQNGKASNHEFETLAAEEAFLRSRIRTLAIEACKLRRQMMDLRPEEVTIEFNSQS